MAPEIGNTLLALSIIPSHRL